MDITVTNLTIDDISRVVRNEIRSYFEGQEEKEREDEIGGIELALELTGLAKSTIYWHKDSFVASVPSAILLLSSRPTL